KFSEISLAPLKTLSTESATVGLSVSVLNPAKTLPTTSEGTRLTSGNFPAPLLSESAIAETRLSVSPLNPVKALATASEMVGVSVGLQKPMKPPLATEDTGGASEKYLAPVLLVSAVMPARLSVSPLNPVKTLTIASDIAGISASALNPVKSLTMASERGGVSESVLNPWKSLVLESETTGLSPGGALSPWKNFPCESEMVGFSVSEHESANAGVLSSLAELTVVSRTVSPEAPATVTWSQYSTTRNWTLL